MNPATGLGGARTPGHLPVIQQNEIAECGLACLAMVARYHGHDVDLAGLRRRFPVSLKGASLSRLITVSGHLGFDARPLRAEPEHLPDLRLPCILHWNLNHFVVLKRIHRGKAEIHDPARGALTMPLEEFGRHFTGVVLELTPAAGFSPVRERQRITLRGLIGQVHGVRRAATQILLLALALEIFTLALPLALQWVIDLVLVSADLDLLALIGIGFLAVVVFQSAVALMRGWIVAELGASLSAQWIGNLFSHLLRLPLDYFEKRSVGGVLSRFISVQSIQQTVTGSFIEAILDGLTVALVLVLLAIYSGPLTLLVLAAFALYAALRWISYRRLQQLKEEQLVHLGRQQSQMIESIEGVQTIKLANKQGERRARVANATIEVANREASINRVTATFSALSRLIFGTQRILLIWIGAWLVLRGQFTAGMLVVFVAYAELFAIRGGSLIDKLVEFRLLGMHGARIADIALEPPEAHVASTYAGPPPEPRIEVENVSFRYAEDDPWVLHDCSLRIEAGECVAIVGPSGGGKTTLAKILLGLLRPNAGTVRIGGVDIEHFGLSAYRDLLGAVMQDDALFAGSIADNISFFDSDASMEAIETAARAAQIHDDIAAMPMGYESLVGDMGSSLSGGQKQRVLLARALYRKPAILLLDEATSHLDVQREREINHNISALPMTRIVIAHRPETIRSADRVIALRDGRVDASDEDRERIATRESSVVAGRN
ncbi:peptidase domain-containing ABC transporter [Marilutibacter chinensis]|uniref:Peptidase domain-containing ABC transporter n=1 Tax=Marilutibacter chinensis TaxID=2912247 RepID=A0ABS9HW55_9GAMM|nr:peptidase domain-containing ABC transporter [Lysobacter chinensis]MCF7223141.1 peptidase domain-containing ABC transporter [Lysobacter chinensis]